MNTIDFHFQSLDSFSNKTSSNKNLRFPNGNIKKSSSSDNWFAFASALLSPHVYTCKHIEIIWMSYPVIFLIMFCAISKENLWAHHWQQQDLINVQFKTCYLLQEVDFIHELGLLKYIIILISCNKIIRQVLF